MKTVFCKDILELICEFGWGAEDCDLENEIYNLIQFRGATPPSCVKPTMQWSGHRYGYALNPWHRDLPYTPLSLIVRASPYEDLTICARQISRYIFRNLKTYWGVFRRYCQTVAHGDANAWNKFIVSIWSINREISVEGEPHNRLMLILSEAEEAELLNPKTFSQLWHEPLVSCS